MEEEGESDEDLRRVGRRRMGRRTRPGRRQPAKKSRMDPLVTGFCHRRTSGAAGLSVRVTPRMTSWYSWHAARMSPYLKPSCGAGRGGAVRWAGVG